MSEEKLIDFGSLQPVKQTSNISKIKKNSFKKLSILGNVKEGELKSKDVIQALFQRFHNHRYMINNAVIFGWESDFFTVTESDYIYEIEVKVSRGDFKDDFNKVQKHVVLEGKGDDFNDKRPNKFFYAAPKGLLQVDEIPKYAGFLEVESGLSPAVVVKDAPFLHKNNILSLYKDTLLDKFSWRYKQNLLNDYQNAINNLENMEENT